MSINQLNGGQDVQIERGFHPEYLERDALVGEDQQPISLEVYMERRAKRQRGRGYVLLDGNSPFTYPRLGLDPEGLQRFLAGIRPAIHSLYVQYGLAEEASVSGAESDASV